MMHNDATVQPATQLVTELVSLESLLRDSPLVFCRTGGIRGMISLETDQVKQVGKLWPAWNPFFHRISGEIGSAQITLISRGVFQRQYILLENDLPILTITKQIMSRKCQVHDWHGQI